MATNTKIVSYGMLSKRLASCNDDKSSTFKAKDVFKKYDNLTKIMENTSSDQSLKSTIRDVLAEFANTNVAQDSVEPILHLVEVFNEKNSYMASYIVNTFTSSILPCIKDLSYLPETVSRYEEVLTEEQKEEILSATSLYEAADRILKNHQSISKRFNISAAVDKINLYGLNNVVYEVSKMIDTYDVTPYQKLNICMEELTYLLDKKGVEYSKKELLSEALKYFLLSTETLNSKDREGYKVAIDESYCLGLSDNEINSFSYIWNESIDEDATIDNAIHTFLSAPEKTTESLQICLNIVLKSDPAHFPYKFGDILDLLWYVYRSDLMDSEDVYLIIDNFIDELSDLIKYHIESSDIIDKEYIKAIADIIDEVKLNVLKVPSSAESYCDKFLASLNKFEDVLAEYIDIVYTEYNLSILSKINTSRNIVTLVDEGKFFKGGLLAAARNLDKYLKEKCDKAKNQAKDKLDNVTDKIKKVLWPENESYSIYSFIGDDSKVDMCLYRAELTEDMKTYFVSKELDTLCQEFNYQLDLSNTYDARCYYIINPGVAEIHLKSLNNILLTEKDLSLIAESDEPDFDYYIEKLSECITYSELLEKHTPEDIMQEVYDKVEYLDNESFNAVLEALSIIGVYNSDISVLAEKYLDNLYIQESANTYQSDHKLIENAVTNWEACNDMPYTSQIQAYLVLEAILSEADRPTYFSTVKGNKEANDAAAKKKLELDKAKLAKQKEEAKAKADKEEVKKNPFKGINVASLRLFLQGLKVSFKDMSQKEKELSRNIDAVAKQLVKSFKDAMISDRREAIIKGSVIPSFSKCIKIAIALAGIGKFVGLGAAVITAIGGFAISKRLTQKERTLLLDEIDTELEVVDKEISIAESNNQMKKYRALLKYKKDLQRQYQRIRYNIRVGKDILPGSTVGLKNND